MIPDKQIKEIRTALINSARPLIFFDDDADGLCSFLQFYKLNPEAKGVLYKTAGPLDNRFLNKIEQYQPDTVFILDIPEVAQEFLDNVKNVYWIDHHTPQKKKNVKYYNPMILSKGMDHRPISYWASKITQNSKWLALTGCVGDWFLPEDLRKGFEYKDLLPKSIKKPEDALFKTDVGKLAKIFNFILKGNNKEAMTCVKVLTRIKDPYEILEQTTSKGKFIWKKFLKTNSIYNELINSVKVTKDKIILYIYTETRTSLTSELSNEILYKNPDKFIIIARENNNEMKCSLRSSKYEVLTILNNALKDVQGYGGGHLHACGANINKDDFDRFLESVRKQL